MIWPQITNKIKPAIKKNKLIVFIHNTPFTVEEKLLWGLASKGLIATMMKGDKIIAPRKTTKRNRTFSRVIYSRATDS